MSQIHTICKFLVGNVLCFEIFFKIVIKISPLGGRLKKDAISNREL